MIISKMRLGSEICSCDTFTCIYGLLHFQTIIITIFIITEVIYLFISCFNAVSYYFIYKRKRKKYQKQKTRQFVTLMLQATVHHQHVLRELKIQK